MKVKAAVVREKAGPFELGEIDLDEPRADEVLVRIVGAGICHTDLACRDQELPAPLPCVFGHEGSGVVEQVGADVTKVAPGDHVVLTYRACGKCKACLAGKPYRCINVLGCNFSGAREDGSSPLSEGSSCVHGSFFNQSSFANFALANESNTVKIDKELPLELFGPLGCGVQTGAGAVLNTIKPNASSSIIIFGCGPVGLSALMAAKVVGCTTIIAVDITPERLDLADTLGATHTINATENVVDQIKEITDGGADYSVVCVGIPQVLVQGLESIASWGECCVVGAASPEVTADIKMFDLMLGKTIKGSIEGDCHPDVFIPQLIELYRKGLFPLDKLITFYHLDDIEKAVRDMEDGKVVKPVLRPA